MNLPYQAPSVDREASIGETLDGNVSPAFWGALASAVAPIAIEAGKGLLKKLF